MASPLKAFRKNQKLMMAIITILAMFGFVFVGPWTGFGERDNTPQNPEVFTWKYGTVTEKEIYEVQTARRLVNGFLYNAADKAGIIDNQTATKLNYLFPPDQSQVALAMLLAKKAEQMGIIVDDASVNEFLRDWTERKVSDGELRQLIRSTQLPNGMSLTEDEVFDTVRLSLQALYVREAFLGPLNRRTMYGVAFAGDTPADRWSYYCQVNRKATAEIYPVAVADFVSEIPDPSEAELQKFYDENKNKVPNPRTEEPGFKQPYRAKFQYFKANFDEFVAEEKPKVTEEEIKAEYETNKDRDYRKKQLPDLPKEGDQPAKEKTEATTSPGDTQAAPAGAGSGSEKQMTGANEKKSPPAETKPAATTESKLPEAKKTEQPMPDVKSPSAPKTDGKGVPAGKKSSSLQRESSLDGELLALADENLLAQGAKPPESKTPDVKAAETNPPDAKPSDAKTPDAKAPDAQAPETKNDATPGVSVPPVEYEPLEKVADDIRKRLAEQKASERVQKAFTALTGRMNAYRSELSRFNAKIGPKPEPLDFAALAKEYALEAKETEMISDWQALDDTDIGKSSTYGTYDPLSFVAVAYGSGQVQPAITFDAKETSDGERNSYLWWKIAEEKAKVPPLAEIRADVVKSWKLIEARKPAKKKAEELAEQVRKAEQPMRDVLVGRDVATAGPFSWLDRNLGQVPQISEVSGVKNPGFEFMRTVFSLEPGGVGVAPNFPQNTYYVIQVEKYEPSLDELENGFMTSMSNLFMFQPYAAVGAADHNNDPYGWFDDLKKQFDFQYVRKTEPQEPGSGE